MKKRMEDELWMRKIKERLEDYSEPLPVSGWERLEAAGSRKTEDYSFPPLGCSCGCVIAYRGVVSQCVAASEPCGRGNEGYGCAGIGNCSGQTAGATDTFDTDRNNRT